MMLGIVVTNKEKMPPFWFERGFRLTSFVYKEALQTKVLPLVRMITKKSDYVFQSDRAPAHMAKTVQAFTPKTFAPIVTRFECPRHQLVGPH